jgi:hypothetical protein
MVIPLARQVHTGLHRRYDYPTHPVERSHVPPVIDYEADGDSEPFAADRGFWKASRPVTLYAGAR